MQDLEDQLKNLFPDHQEDKSSNQDDGLETEGLWIQDAPLECRYVKIKAKPNTIISGYTGHQGDFKQLAKELKTTLGVGGSFKNDQIIIQGDYRDKIMDILKDKGFKVKRVGG
jgi:translation initiation factor 1